ncbi:MAG: hypothetical protein RIF41_18425 [Polyangiaceae bacterium]|uniref:DUF2786 domain-containing protein n=1 Tax=Thalassobaculum fulvum TaxID=1633335 RepID=A0A918XRJ3_9PROT|nr:hypothetical protein [Thalassobaculum fulvum]GHD47770.1 hypothetical protein GCM10017083_18530 [Thalassobaculum fulvum]
MEQMTAHDYERLLKLVALLGSDRDGEILNAVAAASRILNSYGLDWSDIVLPRKLLPVRASAADDLADTGDEDGTSGPPPLDRATPAVMFRLLMASTNVSADAKRDIRRHAEAIREGRVTPAIRGELQTMYTYAVLRGRPI